MQVLDEVSKAQRATVMLLHGDDKQKAEAGAYLASLLTVYVLSPKPLAHEDKRESVISAWNTALKHADAAVAEYLAAPLRPRREASQLEEFLDYTVMLEKAKRETFAMAAEVLEGWLALKKPEEALLALRALASKQ
jgi:hypothetical protein